MSFLDYFHGKEGYSLMLHENLVQPGEGEHLAELANHCDHEAGWHRRVTCQGQHEER